MKTMTPSKTKPEDKAKDKAAAKVVKLLEKKGDLTRDEIASALDMEPFALKALLDQMRDAKSIRSTGATRGTRYGIRPPKASKAAG